MNFLGSDFFSLVKGIFLKSKDFWTGFEGSVFKPIIFFIFWFETVLFCSPPPHYPNDLLMLFD